MKWYIQYALLLMSMYITLIEASYVSRMQYQAGNQSSDVVYGALRLDFDAAQAVELQQVTRLGEYTHYRYWLPDADGDMHDLASLMAAVPTHICQLTMQKRADGIALSIMCNHRYVDCVLVSADGASEANTPFFNTHISCVLYNKQVIKTLENKEDVTVYIV